jgi:drug/metabolite transporter (DMT)-like permease
VSNHALFAVAALIWGSTWLVITVQLGSIAPEASVAYRFALAALVLAAWCRATGRKLRFTRAEHAGIAAQGSLMFGINYIAVYWAEQHVASGLVAVVFSTIVVMNLVASHFLFGTPLGARALAGASLGVGGVALLFLPALAAARSGDGAVLGIGWALGATLLACGANMLAVRNQRRGIPVLTGTAWGMAYGALAAVAVGAARGIAWSFDTGAAYVASLAYLAVFGSVVAFGAYLTLLKRVGAGPASYVGVVATVVALLMSTVFENQRWTVTTVAGVALAVAGNVLVLWRPRRGRNRGPR